MKALVSKASDERTTPAELYAEAVRRWGRYVWDAWATRANTLCPRFCTAQTSAFRRRFREPTFANPPYSRGFIPAALEFHLGQVVQRICPLVTLLINCDTSAKYFHAFVLPQSGREGAVELEHDDWGALLRVRYRYHQLELLMLKGRKAFNGMESGAFFPSCFITWTPRGRA